MIKHLFLFCLILGLSTVSGLWLMGDPGYILMIFHGWQIQTSIVVFFFAIILTSLMLAFGFKILYGVISLPSTIYSLWCLWKKNRQQNHLNLGLEAYFQEEWPLALKRLKSLNMPHAWLIDLLAASAAQQKGDLQERDMLIYDALSQKPNTKDSIILFQAKLQIEKSQFEQAQASLEQIPLHTRYHSPLWLILQTQLDIHFNHHKKALERLMTYKKLLQSHHHYLDLYRICLSHEIDEALKNHQVFIAFELYKAAPSELKMHADILRQVVPHLDHEPKLLKSLYQYLKKHTPMPIPQDLLLVMSDFPQPQRMLEWLDQLPSHAHDAYYFYTKGKLNARQKIWGLAIRELQQSISIKENIPAYTELAEIHLELQQTSHALEAMQKALKLKTLIG